MRDYKETDLQYDSVMVKVREKHKNEHPMYYGDVVFAIKCIPNGRMYIGCSSLTGAESALKSFLYRASKGNDKNALMQRDYNLYGADSFDIEVLSDCNGIGNKDNEKQRYIDRFGGLGSKQLYNLTDTIHRHVSYFNTISNELKEIGI